MKRILLVLLVNVGFLNCINSQTLDQNVTGSVGSGWLVNSGAYTTLGQSFTAGLNGFLRRVDISLDANNPTYPLIAGNFSITIRSGNGYAGTILGVDTFTILGTEPSGYFTINIKPNTVPMVSGNSYTFIIDEISGTGQIMMSATSNVYSGGDLYWQVFTNNPNVDTGRDFIFRTYVQSACANTFSSFTTSTCDSLVSPSGKYVWKTTGSYNDTISNAANCDSIMTFNLVVTTTPSNQTVSVTNSVICSGDSTTVNLASTQNGVRYSLRDNSNNNVLASNVANGTPLNFGTGALTSTKTYNILAENVTPSALDLPATNDYVRFTNPFYNYTNEITVEAWVKFNGVNNPQAGQSTPSLDNMTGNVWLWEGGAFFVNDNGTWKSLAFPITKPIGWTHVATVANSSGMYIYYDTVLVASTTSQQITSQIRLNSNSVIDIGQDPRFTPGSSGRNSNLPFDHFMVWDTTRTKMEIANDMSNCLTGNEPGLVHYTKINEGTGVFIASNKGPNGTLVNPGTTNWIDGPGVCEYSCSSQMLNIVTVIVNQPTTSTINPISCFSYTSPSGKIFSTSNTYIDTIPNANSCDSIITINLTINTVDTSVTVNAPTFSANASGATYQWINCSTNQPVSGANNQNFTATSPGNYAVIVTQNGCTDTSACYSAGNVGLEYLSLNTVKVYPNPTNGLISLELLANSDFGYQLTSIDGRLIEEKKNITQNKISLDLSNESSGFYILKLFNNESSLNIKISKN